MIRLPVMGRAKLYHIGTLLRWASAFREMPQKGTRSEIEIAGYARGNE